MKDFLKVTLVQSNLHWENIEANLFMFESALNSYTEAAEIIVLPEMFTTGFSMNPSLLAEDHEGKTISWMKEMAFKKKAILTGSVMLKEADQYYNRLIWMQPNGVFGSYDKRHLFSYADEHLHYTAGNKRFIAQVNGWKICTQTCYDLRFPVWNRLASANEYDVLLFVANWPTSRIEAWDTLLRARAIENQCYVVAVNRVGEDGKGNHYPGHSCVISPIGEIIYKQKETENISTIILEKECILNTRIKFPFANDKDNFIFVP